MDDEMDMDYQYSQQESSPNHQTTGHFVSYQQQQPQLQQSLPQPQQQHRSLCPAWQDHSSYASPQHYNPHASQGAHDRQITGRHYTGYPFDPVHHSSVAPLPWPQTSQAPAYNSWSPNGHIVGDQHSFTANPGQTLPFSLPYPSGASQDNIGEGASSLGAFSGGSGSSLSAQTQGQVQEQAQQAQPSMSTNTHHRNRSYGQQIGPPLPLPTYQHRWSHGPRLTAGSTPSSMSSMSSGTTGEHSQGNVQRISQQQTQNPQQISFYAEASPPPSNPAGTATATATATATTPANQASRGGYPLMQRARSGQSTLSPLPQPHLDAGNSVAQQGPRLNMTSVTQETRTTNSSRWQAQQQQQVPSPLNTSISSTQSSLPLPRGRVRSGNDLLRFGEFGETSPARGGTRLTVPGTFADTEAQRTAAAAPSLGTGQTRLQHGSISRVPEPVSRRSDGSDFDSEEDDLSDPYADDERAVNALAQQYLSGSARTDRVEGMAESRIRLHQLIRGQLSNKRIASRGAIASLQSVDIATIPETERSCIICYNDFGVENPEGIAEDPLRLPKCKHIFGDHCIKKWLADSDTCPYCRDKLPSELQSRGTMPDPQAVRDLIARNEAQISRYRRAEGTTLGDVQDTANSSSAAHANIREDMLSRYVSMSGRLNISPPRTWTGERGSPPSEAPEAGRRRTRPRRPAMRGSSSTNPATSQTQVQTPHQPQTQTQSPSYHQRRHQGPGQNQSQGQGQGQSQGQERERVNTPYWLPPADVPRWQLTSLLARQYSAGSDQANQHAINEARFRQTAQAIVEARQQQALYHSQAQQHTQHQQGQHPPNDYSQFPPVPYPSGGPYATGLPNPNAFQHMAAGSVGGSSPSSGSPFWPGTMMGQDQMDIDRATNFNQYPGSTSSRAG